MADNFYNNNIRIQWDTNDFEEISDIQQIKLHHTKIQFSDLSNQFIDNLLHENITHIDMLWSNFNQTIDFLPNSLLHLRLSTHFNQPVNNLPNKLISLCIGPYFNQNVDNLPHSLQNLIFQNYSNINNNNNNDLLSKYTLDKLPPNLIYLNIYGHLRNGIKCDNLPNNLQYLVLRCSKLPIENLPCNITELILGGCF